MDVTSTGTRRGTSVRPGQVRVFINYRHDDTQGEAQLLYDRLANRFGRENVFLDVRTLQPGMKWLDEIKAHSDSAHVFLSLIGPRWISIMRTRNQAAAVHPAEDYVRSEIQRALRPSSGIQVIPVLVGANVSIKTEDLPKSLRTLAMIEHAQIRHELLDRDIEALIGGLEEIGREKPVITPESATVREEDRSPASASVRAEQVAPPPDAAHCEKVLQQMVDEDNLVLFLGSRMTAGRADAAEDPVSLLDAEELAARLAERFRIQQRRQDLPEIAQYVYATRGLPDLYKGLKELLVADAEPGPVHRFLARFPGTLGELGLEKRPQLIVSTNFDMALERAFDDEEEPYHLAVYMAYGQDKGKFVHFPPDGVAAAIARPNSYTEFPIGEDGELWETVIVKIHGAIDYSIKDYRWRENYVITEDHYIDYLSRSPIESLVPVQILGKLRQSHCLFLGYTVRDWNLRVFLKRIWEEGRLEAESWAVEPDPDAVERGLWKRANVDLYAADLAGYVRLLEEQLADRTSKSARP
jgi:SIR2-like domain/TIR domain